MSLSLDQISAVLLAGGLGTRIRAVAPHLPKPMIPVQGRPFLEWVVRYLGEQGIRRVIISTGYRSEVVEQHFAQQRLGPVAVQCVREDRPLGTAGGARHAIRRSGPGPGAWLVMNGDSLVLAPLAPMIECLAEPGVAGVLLGVTMAEASRYGRIVSDAQGNLVGFEEKQAGGGIISAGVYLLRSAVIDELPDRTPLSFETEVFPLLTARRVRLKVLVCEAPFLDIGTPESLLQAESFIRQGQRFFLDL